MTKVNVNADVKVIPARRTAAYDVPINPEMAHLSKKLIGKVNAGAIVFALSGSNIEIPKTLAALDAFAALIAAVRDELVVQGVEE